MPEPAGREQCWRTDSAEETRRLGRALGAHLEGRDVVCLRGPLGAGKTTLIQGLAEGLGVGERVTSPSFTLIHEHQGRLPLYHLDLYRLAAGDLPGIGVEEVLAADAVVAIEWAERLPAGLCADALEVEMQFGSGEDERRIVMRARGARGRRILEALEGQVDACTRH